MRESSVPWWLLIGLHCYLAHITYAQTGVYSVLHARIQALAHQGAAVRGLEALALNPAVLAFEEEASILISAESRFIGSGLQGANLSTGIPLLKDRGTIAFGLNYFGIPEFNQVAFTLGYGRKLTKGLALGAAMEYHSFRIDQTMPTTFGNVLLGLQCDITSSLCFGVAMYKPFDLNNRLNQNPSSGFKTGLQYKISNLVRLYCEVEKNNIFPWYFKAAVEYEFLPILTLRLGVTTGIASFTSGIAVKLSDAFSIDMTSVFYQGLGVSPSVSLRYSLTPKTQAE